MSPTNSPTGSPKVSSVNLKEFLGSPNSQTQERSELENRTATSAGGVFDFIANTAVNLGRTVDRVWFRPVEDIASKGSEALGFNATSSQGSGRNRSRSLSFEHELIHNAEHGLTPTKSPLIKRRETEEVGVETHRSGSSTMRVSVREWNELKEVVAYLQQNSVFSDEARQFASEAKVVELAKRTSATEEKVVENQQAIKAVADSVRELSTAVTQLTGTIQPTIQRVETLVTQGTELDKRVAAQATRLKTLEDGKGKGAKKAATDTTAEVKPAAVTEKT